MRAAKQTFEGNAYHEKPDAKDCEYNCYIDSDDLGQLDPGSCPKQFNLGSRACC
jgi:hypothetical protein